MRDILLDENNDLKIINGDFLIGESTNQNVELLFTTSPGEWKEHIETGIAIQRSNNGNLDRFLDRTIRVQMEADGYHIEKLVINELGVSIDGQYE
ncbi:hypothetical protein [Flavobacterium psychrophilum]|uniref:hypothetical protein n=1 Tax=Flavobacterium psychrophilum TaxID=96345 RepID=UPI001069BEE6|nr:hypothetical protein [Flavobacterium psychrophilum]